jgi:3-isopropylmalate/(R)-2-methylmalate dehydratase small subunit
MKLEGRVWKLGDHVNATDIVSGKYDKLAMSAQYEECGKHVLEDVYPGARDELKAGDILVAGDSFGMGHAHYFGGAILGGRAAGLSAYLAESINGIFERMAIEWGMPALAFPGIADFVNDGDRLSFDLRVGEANNLTTGAFRQFKPVSPIILDIVDAGGSSNWARKRVGALHAIQ